MDRTVRRRKSARVAGSSLDSTTMSVASRTAHGGDVGSGTACLGEVEGLPPHLIGVPRRSLRDSESHDIAAGKRLRMAIRGRTGGRDARAVRARPRWSRGARTHRGPCESRGCGAIPTSDSVRRRDAGAGQAARGRPRRARRREARARAPPVEAVAPTACNDVQGRVAGRGQWRAQRNSRSS